MLSRRGFVIAMGAPLVLVGGALAGWRGWTARERARGAALFHGDEVIDARLAGHEQPLPALATRCSNCHAREATATVAGAPAALDAEGLTGLRSRRYGPPSRFDAASLCRLLRSGVDPAHVMLPQTMPRYAVSDRQCAALWAFLSTP